MTPGKPLLILDQHFRTLEELFSDACLAALAELCEIEGGKNRPMNPDRVDALIGKATFLVAARPAATRDQIVRAKGLKAVIEVSGAFNKGLDYAACFDHGIEVLSCAPGFRYAVAEMGLAMILSAARGLVAEHEAFRANAERWLDDREGRDFSLFGQSIGFLGYGNIAREMHELLRPFAPKVRAHDPWISAFPDDVKRQSLIDLFSSNRVLVVAAVPTEDNRHLVDAGLIGRMQPGSVIVVLSRAHVVDFDAALEAAQSGRITLATDVFPSEPLTHDDPLRQCPNVILSPHRAAAVPGGRHPIGDMILHDVSAILEGRAERQLLRAVPERLASLITAQAQIAKDGRQSKT